MGLYDKIFARLYDASFVKAEKEGLADERAKLIAQATGDVLEIGAGTGLNLAHYGPGVTSLVLTEPSEPMADQLRGKLGDRSDAQVEIVGAESLPFADESFDCVVCTLVLCTVDDPDAAVAEIRRVLRPGGRLLLIEHVRNEDPSSAKWQDRFERPWKAFGNGCRCNRDTAATVSANGFDVTGLKDETLPAAPPIIRPLIVGVATIESPA